MKIGLARRGYSSSGGAEAYLRRFAAGLEAAGHTGVLFTGSAWPASEWPGELRRVKGGASPRAFARALAEAQPRLACDFLFSLERVLACDAYRAGDGVHAVWLEQRARGEWRGKSLFRRWQPKHRQILALEEAMFARQTAGRVIANSRMVAQEIVSRYGYPEERIRVVYNGVPAPVDRAAAQRMRAEARQELGAAEDDYLLLFAGSGWERKGLRFAIRAVEAAAAARPLLLVAGRGQPRSMPASSRVRYLGAVPGLARWLAAADAFLLPTRYDPFSNACLEASVAGLPVITTAANGFAETITPAEGTVLAEAAEIEPMARAIEQWAEPGRREAARELLSVKAAAFSIERNVRESLAFFLDASRRPPACDSGVAP